MRQATRGFCRAVLTALAFVSAGWAATPELEVLSDSTITLGVAGAERAIDPQAVGLAPAWQAGFQIASTAAVAFPRVELAFGEFVDVYQNQALLGNLNPQTGQGSLELSLWVRDSDGNAVELPLVLTTDMPSTTDCSGYPFCLGIEGDPDYCAGSARDPGTGEMTLAGATVVPFGSGTTIDCSALLFVVEARIAPGDADGDLVEDPLDNCPDDSNGAQADADLDGVGDACDNCSADFNPQQRDTDGNGAGNACEPLLVNFQPAAAVLPAGYEKDSGLPFSAAGGFGWLTQATLQSRERNVAQDQRLDTFVFTAAIERWEAVLPPALYDFELTIGDAAYVQGPQSAEAEGTMLFDQVTTQAGEHLVAELDAWWVADGRVTVEAGGGGGNTALDYVTAVESALQPFAARTFNFQPATSTLPEGFEIDTGAVYDELSGHGWDLELPSRDRDVLGDPVLDTLVFTNGSYRSWEAALPPDYYEVRLSVGDAAYAQGPMTVEVEGQSWLSGGAAGAGEFLTLSGRVFVLDGSLTVGIGEPGGITTLNYVSVASLPEDLDGDGVGNLPDNCPEVYNPGQEDADGDGIGDHCSADTDEDGWPDVLDNCPDASNPGQEDADSDTVGDPCDCAPGDGGSWAEVIEVQSLLLFEAAPALIAWYDQSGESGDGTTYDLVRQTLSSLRDQGSFAGAGCFENDWAGNVVEDGAAPAAGDGFLYLVRAQNGCGTGTYGVGSTPDPRAGLDALSPCP